MEEFYINEAASISAGGGSCRSVSLSFHRKMPGYIPTPLVESPRAAERLGVARVFVKDESNRLSLPSFKILGASWAVYRILKQKITGLDTAWSDLDRLRIIARGHLPGRLITATDGNHGRAVARVASWLGIEARIFMPQGSSRHRIEAIRSEGADVTVVEGDYDHAVSEAAAIAGKREWLIQDMAWEGYEDIPRAIVEGYSTIFSEIQCQLDLLPPGEESPRQGDIMPGHPAIDLAAVQIGVGSLAEAAVRYLSNRSETSTPVLLGVEPASAACALAAVKENRVVKVRERGDTIMAGLNCGKVSRSALPVIRRGIGYFVAIEDRWTFEAMRILASDGIVSGESGAAGLAGLIYLSEGSSEGGIGKMTGIGPKSNILLISTEGITDPDIYRTATGGKNR
ncbi:MAG: diaminopropionate ammonia-lyase [Candidatus Krumholzibacteriota bacterium]|nr:diaminopropionate ammonia-lyase [Candidatus Krumholzibacteriota bacterium]